MRPHQGPGHGFGALEIKSAVIALVVTESMLGEQSMFSTAYWRKGRRSGLREGCSPMQPGRKDPKKYLIQGQ